MNERIKELAEQAWDATAVSPDFGHPVSFAEKFAELILQGCIDLLDDDTRDIHPRSHDYCVSLIKEHFGIEE